MERNKKIIQTSVIGIASNLVLILFKMGVGLVAHSIAIILDAINNLGDVLSMVITIIGTKLASKAPDKKHPYGYGRIEYISSILISFIILAAGLISVRESVTKIVNPEPAEYTYVSLIIIAAAVVGKFLSGRYIKSVGEKINAQSLVASGSDAFFGKFPPEAGICGRRPVLRLSHKVKTRRRGSRILFSRAPPLSGIYFSRCYYLQISLLLFKSQKKMCIIIK